PWFSQKLAEPMGRWAFRAQTRAAVVFAAGRWLSGIAGMVLGGLAIYEGARDSKLNKGYGFALGLSGTLSVVSSLLVLFAMAIPLAIILMIIAAAITVVVAWFKPDDTEHWMDRALHFGKNAAGEFQGMDEQMDQLKKIRV
ncbi:hypothetical protein, partial [Stenotrophomonas maltophilia]